MTQSAKLQEPSMEEILASIRRIIADDETKSASPAPAARETPPQPRPTPPPAPPRPVTPLPPRPAAVAPPPPPPREPAQIQSDIEAVLGNPAPGSGNGAAPPAEPDVLELTEDMKSPSFRTIDSEPDVIFTEAAPEPPPPAPEPIAEAPRSTADLTSDLESAARRYVREDALISRTTSSAVDSAFNTLAHTVLVQNGRTLEDLVREMLRPMLKTWLDDNLPGLVERLVRAEIERVSRGR